MWHSKNTQLKTFSPFRTMLSNYIIYSRVLRHPRFYIMEQFQYRFAEIGSKWFLFVLWKKFPVFQVTYYRSTPKNHAYLNDPQCYTWLLKKYFRLHRVNISKILGNVWLLLLVLFLCTPPSSSTLRFPQSSSMNRNLGKFSKFPMSSTSTRLSLSSSSSIATFSEGLSSSMKPWLKTKLEKWNKSVSANVVASIFFHICFFGSVENIVTKVNQIR